MGAAPAQQTGAKPAHPQYTSDQIKSIIADVARSMGIDPNLAIATAEVESGLNPYSVGDSGTSFGLFQLHRGGELGSMTPEQAYDPATNTRRALSEFVKVAKTHPGIDPGQLAALSQRPADPSGYARKVDSALSHLGPAPTGSVGGTPVSTVDNPLNPLSGLSGIGDTLNTLNSKSFWVRVAFIVGGLIVVLIGVAALARDGTLSHPQDAPPIQQNGKSSVVGKGGSTSTEAEEAAAA